MPRRQVTPVALISRANRLLTTLSGFGKALVAALVLVLIGPMMARADSFADPGVTTAWSASRWNNTADASPYNATYTANNNVTFTTNKSYSFAGMGAAID